MENYLINDISKDYYLIELITVLNLSAGGNFPSMRNSITLSLKVSFSVYSEKILFAASPSFV